MGHCCKLVASAPLLVDTMGRGTSPLAALPDTASTSVASDALAA